MASASINAGGIQLLEVRVTLTPLPTDPQATEIGPPPPFDPECGAVLAPLAEVVSPAIPVDMIPVLRASQPVPPPTDDDLRRGGAFSVEERSVPGPEGAPEISLPF